MVAEDPEVAAAISDLLVRRVDPEHGRVLVGGVDTRELSLDALRAHVVTVDGHHPWLVDGTLGENLALGAPDADPSTLERALLDAAGEDLLTRRNGIDQPIGERGLSLSGGQRQRLTVARSYAASPPVLVLDEPTSALDVVTELRLLSRLRDARAGRTTRAAHHQRTRARAVRSSRGRRCRTRRVAGCPRRAAARPALSGSRRPGSVVTTSGASAVDDHALPTATPKSGPLAHGAPAARPVARRDGDGAAPECVDDRDAGRPGAGRCGRRCSRERLTQRREHGRPRRARVRGAGDRRRGPPILRRGACCGRR